MNKSYGRLMGFVLRRYDENEYLNRKKAEFLVVLLAIYTVMLILLPFGFLAVSFKRFMVTFLFIAPFFVFNAISFYFIIRGRSGVGATIIAVTAVITDTFFYFAREPLMAIASFGYVMIMIIVFAAFYTPTFISFMITAVYVISHIVHIVTSAKVITDATDLAVIKTANIDSNLTVIIIYVICYSTARFLQRAVDLSDSESEKNHKQLGIIRNLVGTLKRAGIELDTAITSNLASVNQLNDNAQSQAATMEEISSAIEEISANITNVNHEALVQNSSVEELMNDLSSLTGSVELLEQSGRRLSQTFVSVMTRAREGENESTALEEINRKISENSNDILSVVNIIEEFFEKINLLALNASIEAARAGDYGRGFAVVAEEIGKLSDNSAKELGQITAIIDRNRADVKNGSAIIDRIVQYIGKLMEDLQNIQSDSMDTMKEIMGLNELKEVMTGKAEAVKEKSHLIKSSMNEQSQAMDDIARAIQNNNEKVQDNLVSTESIHKSALDLKDMSEELAVRLSDAGQ